MNLLFIVFILVMPPEPTRFEIDNIIIKTNEYCLNSDDIVFDDCFEIMMPKFIDQLIIDKFSTDEIKI